MIVIAVVVNKIVPIAQNRQSDVTIVIEVGQWSLASQLLQQR